MPHNTYRGEGLSHRSPSKENSPTSPNPPPLDIFYDSIFFSVVNVLGSTSGGIDRTMIGINAAMSMPRAVVHWYGKGYQQGRKIATATANENGIENIAIAHYWNRCHWISTSL